MTTMNEMTSWLVRLQCIVGQVRLAIEQDSSLKVKSNGSEKGSTLCGALQKNNVAQTQSVKISKYIIT